jgi:hypothetical protein
VADVLANASYGSPHENPSSGSMQPNVTEDRSFEDISGHGW